RDAIAVNAAGQSPRLNDAVSGAADRARHLQAAVETREAVLNRDQDVGVGNQRAVDRIDVEPDAHAPFSSAPRRNALGVVLAAKDERSLALHRAKQRTQLATEFKLVEDQLVAACGVNKDRAAVDQIEPLDRSGVVVDVDHGRRPSQTARSVETADKFRAFE